MPKLVLPSVKYKNSFIKDFLPGLGKSVMEYDSWGKYLNKNLLKKDFAGYVKFIKQQSKGRNLPNGYIPQSIFWLVDENKLLGILSLRHRLTTHLKKIGGHIGYEITPKYRGRGYGNLILKLALKKAKAMGIKKALLTCNATNIRSKKVIIKNGGKYEGKAKQPNGLPYKLRFWIKIK